MLLTEWNIEEAKEVWREEAWEEGREDERKYILELFSQGLSAEEIKRCLEQTQLS